MQYTGLRAVAQDHAAQAPLGGGLQSVKTVCRLHHGGQGARCMIGLARRQAQGVRPVEVRVPHQGKQLVMRLRHTCQQHRAMLAQALGQQVQGIVCAGHGCSLSLCGGPSSPCAAT